ncbi:MAG: hypothetical protein ACLRXQ_10990 [Phascolarctobacterium faecium]
MLVNQKQRIIRLGNNKSSVNLSNGQIITTIGISEVDNIRSNVILLVKTSRVSLIV